MTIQEYIYKFQQFFPIYSKDGIDYIDAENKYEFICDCGQHCYSYGWYKFQRTCIDCAINEVVTDLIWQWYFQKDGVNCLTREQYLQSAPYAYARNYGHHNLGVIVFIIEEANKKFKQLTDNFEYKTLIDLEIGKYHKEEANNYGSKKHQKIILKSMKRKINGYSEYFNILNKLSRELDLPRNEIPKELVLIQLNLINQNRLIRQRRKNYV